MVKWKRKILFWFLTISFLITTPIIILQAKGYRFDINRGVFVYSGAITLKTNPQKINIKLNNKSINSKKLNILNGSYNITGLIPGYYNMQVSADGFKTWNKRIAVHSGVASEFWNILLTKNHYKRTTYNSLGVKNYFISPKNHFIAYTTTSNQGFTTKILDLNSPSENTEFNFPGWKFIGKIRKENIEWSPDESYISIPAQKIDSSTIIQSATNLTNTSSAQLKNINNYFIANLDNKTFFNLNQLLSKKNITNVRWDPNNKGYLFFLNKSLLYRVDVKNADNITQIASNVSSYDLSSSGVYYIQRPNNLIFHNSLDGKANPTQITSKFPGPENSIISKIIVYDNSRIALISKSKDLYIFNQGDHDTYFKKLEGGIEDIQFSNDGKKLLFWSTNEMSVYYLRDWDTQPMRLEDKTQNITRYSEPINNIQWFKDYEHVIFSTGPWIKIIELDSRDHKNCIDLINTQLQKPIVIYNGYFEKLFFIDNSNNTTTLYSIIFPEKTSLFGLGGG